MLDLSWGEIVVIGTVAVIFIGPKELPGALRTLGHWVGKARTMAREFQNNVDDMIREADLDEVKKQVQSGGISTAIQNTIDPKGELKAQVETALAPPPALAGPTPESALPPAPALPTPNPVLAEAPKAPEAAAPAQSASPPILPQPEASKQSA